MPDTRFTALAELAALADGAPGPDAAALTRARAILAALDDYTAGTVAAATEAVRSAFHDWYGPDAGPADEAAVRKYMVLSLAQLRRALGGA